MDVTKDKQVVFQDTRDVITGLHILPLQSLYRTTHQSNNLHLVNSKDNSIKYLHAAAFIPVQDTWERAVNMGYFNTCPGLTSKETSKIPNAEATIKGHLSQSRKNPV